MTEKMKIATPQVVVKVRTLDRALARQIERVSTKLDVDGWTSLGWVRSENVTKDWVAAILILYHRNGQYRWLMAGRKPKDLPQIFI